MPQHRDAREKAKASKREEKRNPLTLRHLEGTPVC
jgi:hypothetical protein